MTIKQYLNRTNKDFVKYGFLSRWHGLIGCMFRSRKHMDKSVWYLDRRWEMMMTVMKSSD